MQEQRNQENAHKSIKTKDHMVEVKNAKRLIAKYAREDREVWQQNLKEKGLWT